VKAPPTEKGQPARTALDAPLPGQTLVLSDPGPSDPEFDDPLGERMVQAAQGQMELALGMQSDLLAAMGGQMGELAMEDKNRPTSIRAIAPPPVTDRPVEPPAPVAIASPRPAPAAGPAPVVAVFDLQDGARKGRLPDDSLDQLTDYLAALLTERVGYRVVPRDQLRARLAEQKTESFRQCFDQSCQIELGRALAAEKSLAAKVLHFGSKCAVTAVLYDLRSETTERATTKNLASCRIEDFMKGLEDVVDHLAAKR
jgi:hypothetical protein